MNALIRKAEFRIAVSITGLEPWPDVECAVKAPIVPFGVEPAPCLPPAYFSDLNEAAKVAEILRQKDIYIEVTSGLSGFGCKFRKVFAEHDWGIAYSTNLAWAICLAALGYYLYYRVDTEEDLVEALSTGSKNPLPSY